MAAPTTPHAADYSTDDEDEDIETERKRISPYRRVVSEAAEKRFIVCSAVVDQDMTINRACTNAGVPSRTYYDLDWVGEYRRGGFEALTVDGRGGTAIKASPNTRQKIKRLARDEKMPAAQISSMLLEEDDKDLRKRRVQQIIKDEGGQTRRKQHKQIAVKTPWDARHRRQFAEEHEDDDPRNFLYLDGKKFCVWECGGDARTCTFFPEDSYGDVNIARGRMMTDDEYLEWRNAIGTDDGSQFPTEKSKGLYATMVYGAVGYNTKSELFIFEEGEKLTKELYPQILKYCVTPLVGKQGKGMVKFPALKVGTKVEKAFDGALFEGKVTSMDDTYLKLKYSDDDTEDMTPREVKSHLKGSTQRKTQRDQAEDLWLIQDNDPKHFAWMRQESNVDWLESQGVQLLQSQQLDEYDQPEEHQSGIYKGQIRIPSFSAYSHDLNATVEKVWRETQYRGLDRARAGEVKNRKDWIRVIKEEWEGIGFEEQYRNGRRWPGINWWVGKWGDICREVQEEGGWDTKYM